MSKPLCIEVEAGTRLIEPIRELVRDGQLPLYWRCGQGTCGACLVFLRHADSEHALPLVMSGKERNVLIRHRHMAQDAIPQDTAQQPRLACHVLLPSGLLQVCW